MTLSINETLAVYLSPEQATVLRYGGSLPPATLAELCAKLRAELAAMHSLLPAPLVRRQHLLERPTGTYWSGSLLCADLSGFTALTEQLSTRGRQGVEELSAIINKLFAALLEELDAYGGVVLKFGGDALTAFFDAEQLGPAHATIAAAAALALQQRMAAFESFATSYGPWTLRLRVGVHSGRIFAAIVGDEMRRELLVAGRTVNRVALAQERAAPGEVLVSSATLTLLEGVHSTPRPGALEHLLYLPPVAHPTPRASLLPLPAGNDRATLEVLATRIAALRPYLPAALPQRFIHASGDGDGGEFRPVSVVFINFFSFSGLLALLSGEEQVAIRAITSYYSRVQQLVYSYGGSLNKLDIGSYGDKLLAVFGAPQAQEDDPLRAVQMALDLRAVLEEANREIKALLTASAERWMPDGANFSNPWRAVDPSLRQRIGVATGSVFAGIVGVPQRREYTVIGETVNLAARLMAAAGDGAVLLNPTTAHAVSSAIALKPLPPLQLKGIATPVPAALALHPLASTTLAAEHAPLIGRDAELAQLRACIHQLGRDHAPSSGKVVVISGEAGIGKSRLARESVRETDGSKLRTLDVSCSTNGQTASYGIVRDMLFQLLGLPVGTHPRLSRSLVAKTVAEHVPYFTYAMPLLYELFDEGHAATDEPNIDVDDAPAIEQMPAMLALLSPMERHQRLYDLAEALVSSMAAQQPLLMLLDDLHQADTASLEMIERLAALTAIRPLLLVLISRSHSALQEPWFTQPQTLSIPLSELTPTSSAALLDALLGGPAPAALLPLLERAQGSPFFLEALVQHLIDIHALERGETAAWELQRPLDPHSIPISVERVLATRLDQLDEQTRELVQVAAVIGMRVPYAVLAGVYSQARRLARQLTDLVSVDILLIDEQDPEVPFRFRQMLLRDVAYNSILYVQRRDLHRRVADRIELLHAGQGAAHAAELARHTMLAEEWTRACAYSIQAGRHAQAQHATAEALHAFRQAERIATLHPEAATQADLCAILEGLSQSETLAGHYDDARIYFNRLVALRTPETINV